MVTEQGEVTEKITDEEIAAAREAIINRTLSDPAALEKFKNSNTVGITFMVPAMMQAQLDEQAGEQGIASFVRKIVADHIGYELVETDGRKKNVDTRQKEIDKVAKREAMKALVERAKANQLNA